jgi:hypothetical protein
MVFSSGKRSLTDNKGWHDIMGQIEKRGVGASDPAWSQISSSAFYAYKFAVNDQVWVQWHIPHDYVLGTPLYFHAHWTRDGTNMNPVKWEWTFADARGYGTGKFNFDTPTVVTAAEIPHVEKYAHEITETEATSPTSYVEPDAILSCRIRRVANGGTDNTDGIFLLNADCHYQSHGNPTPYKRPDFYSGTPG